MDSSSGIGWLAKSFFELAQLFQGALHVRGGDGAGALGGGFFQGALRQVIEQPRQAVASLEQQLQGRRLERVGVPADLLHSALSSATSLPLNHHAP